MTARDDYATWDGAYVLGALSPAERKAYEQHLRACDDCSASLAELTGLPGLLGRVPAQEAFALVDGGLRGGEGGDAADGSGGLGASQDGERPDALPILLSEARRRRRRTRWWAAAGLSAVAAALIAILAVIVPAALTPASTPQAAVTMAQVQPSPLTATVRLAGEPWGTRIDMSCSYAEVEGADGGREWSYVLVVTDRSGKQTPVSTWTASAGTTVLPVATVGVPRDQIRSLEVRAPDGTVLLRSSFG